MPPNARLFDTEGIEKVRVHSPLHRYFRGMGRPASLAESFSQVFGLGRRNEHGLSQEDLEIVQKLALDFSENLILRSNWVEMSEEVRASISVLSVDEAASICAYSMDNGPYRALNCTLLEDKRDQLRPFVEYLWLLMHGLSKCPRPMAPVVYRGVRCGNSASYPVGSVITWRSFSSCTSRLGALENNQFLGTGGERTVFHITLTTNRARSIHHLSIIPDDDHILLPPNTRVRVMGKDDRGHGLFIVHLLEERCFDPILVFPDPPRGPIPPPPPPPPAPLTKPLDQLTNVELERWLTSINMHDVIPSLRNYSGSGEMLALCDTEEEIAEFGLAISRARQLFAKIEEAKARGVPLSLLSAAPVRTGNDIFPVRYTVIVIYCGALVQPYILHIRLTCSTPSPIMYYMKYSPPPR